MEPDEEKTQSYTPIPKGTVISRYRIIQVIGVGGMGEVYLAEDTELERKVALKFMPQQFLFSSDARARFKREAQAAAALNHPNIIHIYEVSEYQGRPFFAMEYVSGQSLRDLIKAKELSLDRIIDLATQICKGLNKAHQAGITHRDIKPSNIVIDADGQPKLLDFGLAAVPSTEKLTKTGSTLGTIGYMSPEQIQVKEIDQRSDLFSFGVLLYEMITGRLPFKGDTEAATLNSVLHDIPEPLSRYKSGVSGELQSIVSKLLEKDPELRYQSAVGVVSDLKRLSVDVVSVEAKPPKDWWNRYVVVAAAIVIVVLAGYWILTRNGQQPAETVEPERKMLAVLPFENLGDPEDEYFADGITEEITSRLAQLSDIGVISRTSAMQYKGSSIGLRQIGQELGVQYILEGTIRWGRQDDINRVRITPQLIDVSDDRHLWADNYERDLTQIFAVQAEIAGRVAAALDIALEETDKSRLEARPTDNLVAYDFFLRGRDCFERGMQRGRDEIAINLLKRAIELDSTFSLAYAWLARASGLVYFHDPGQGRELLDLTKESAEAAFRLSEQGPEGHMAMGYYYYYGKKDYDLALQHFSNALVEQPNNSDAIEAIAYIQRRLGQWQASLKSLERAAELDPRSVRKVIEMQLSALALRQYDLARQYFDLGCKIEPTAQALYERESWRCIMAYGDTRRARQAIEQGRRLIGPGPLDEELELLDIFDRDYQSALRRRPNADAAQVFDDFNFYLYRGWIYSLLGDQSVSVSYFDSARVEFENAVAQAPDFPLGHSQLAIALAGLGKYEDAVRECETALDLLSDKEDALLYPVVLSDMAEVYMLAGNYDEAIKTLDTMLSMPFVVSVNTLKLDPIYDPLRDLPRFQALLEKYEKEHGT